MQGPEHCCKGLHSEPLGIALERMAPGRSSLTLLHILSLRLSLADPSYTRGQCTIVGVHHSRMAGGSETLPVHSGATHIISAFPVSFLLLHPSYHSL